MPYPAIGTTGCFHPADSIYKLHKYLLVGGPDLAGHIRQPLPAKQLMSYDRGFILNVQHPPPAHAMRHV